MAFGQYGGWRRRQRILSCGCVGVCDGSCGTSLAQELIGSQRGLGGEVGEVLLDEELAGGRGLGGGPLFRALVAEELGDNERRGGGQGGYPGGDWA